MRNFPRRQDGIRSRLQAIILSEVPEKGRFRWLEEHAGIARNTWQTFWNRQTANPNGEMIEAISRIFPRYAFWLATGVADERFGHGSPTDYMMGRSNANDSLTTSNYFSELLLFDGVTPSDDVEQLAGLQTLVEIEPATTSPSETTKHAARIDILEKIRWVEIFLDNYLLEFGIDEAIAGYNRMRSIVKKLEADSSNINEKGITENVLKKLLSIKEQLEKQRDWLIERNTKGGT